MSSSVEVSTGPTAAHLAAMEWLDVQAEDLSRYEGEWLAVADDRIVSHGESVPDVIREAAEQGFDDPLLVPVMPYPFIGL